MQSRQNNSRRREILEQVVRQEREDRYSYGVLRGVNVFGLTFFHSLPRNRAKIVLIASLGLVIVLGGCFGVVMGAAAMEASSFPIDIPNEVVERCMRYAMLSVVGLAVTILGVLIHASGATEDSHVRRPTV